MKRTVCILLTLLVLSGLCACSGGSESKNPPVSAGYLPTRLEQILSDPVVPEGHEAKKQPVEGKYTVESFWGEWVRKDADSDDAYANDPVFDFNIEDVSGKTVNLEFSCFPEKFSFMPYYATNSLGMYNLKTQARNNINIVFGELLSYSELEWDHDPLGTALSEHGLGFGTIDYQFSDRDMDTATMMASIGEDSRTIAYAVSNDVLSVGLTDCAAFGNSPFTDDLDATDIYEIDYTFSWAGTELTLSYMGESAVYVPRAVIDDTELKLEEAGVANGGAALDGMIGITLDDTQAKVMYNDLHSGYTDSEIIIANDGTMQIDGRTYTYANSGESLTLIGDNGSSVYSNYSFELASYNSPAYYSFLANGNTIQLHNKTSLSQLIGWGFQTSLDLYQLVNSCQVTDIFTLTYNGAKIDVRVCNPYADPATLGECVVCYILLDDTSGALTKGDGQIGITTYDQIDLLYAPAYEKKPDELRYKATVAGILTDYFDDFFRKRSLDLNGDMEVIYYFENNILQKIELILPSLLYNGLQDNVDNEILENIDAVTMQGYIENRDTVLDRLKAAFTQAGVDVQINEYTGEIVMGSNVLFGFDSTELSAEGRAYIDSFMGVYASVILDDSLKDVISGIYLEGHTDSNGGYSYNLKLSEQRAQAVLDYCLSSSSTSMNRDQKERFSQLATAVGYAFKDLVYTDSGVEDAEASRRVAIKFYVTENPAASPEPTTTTPPSSELTADDFFLTTEGETHNALNELTHGTAWYFWYDGSTGVSRQDGLKTARGIHVGDSVNDLFAAYGTKELIPFDSSHPFYSPDDYRSAMMEECVSFVSYWYGEDKSITFFLDSWNCVSWVVYYVG